MQERMVGSTSSASNVYGVIDDNNNLYRTMVTNAIRMNQGHVSQCSVVDEEPNVDMSRFFDLLKDLTNHYRMVAHITVN
jgi:Tfp pilus assembly protein PilP